jgi:DNA-binding PadR family transcriptional regulator
MIVLALVAQGRDYGLAMEEFVAMSRMRMWAKIGTSTIYKALKDLERDGSLTSQRGEAKRGPGKKVFKLTDRGRKELEVLLTAALTSREPVYSDRIAGLALALSLPKAKARAMITRTIDGLDHGIEELKAEKRARRGDPVATAVLDYYATIYKAEQKAMRAILNQAL